MWRDRGTFDHPQSTRQLWHVGLEDSADPYYAVRPECASSVPQSKFRIKVGKTLSVRKWLSSFSVEGYIDMRGALDRIQQGGVHPSIRGQVWEILLGCFDPRSSHEERQKIRENRRVEYEELKELCKKMFPLIGSGKFVTAPIITETGEPSQDPVVLEQVYGGSLQGMEKQMSDDGPMDKREISWKLTLHQIGLDVVHTDRTLMFYEKQENLAKLWDILSVYSWFVGYCQGMSDLCSPMIMLLENEADAFWCFDRMMQNMRGNLSMGVESQLRDLATVIQVIDPKLHQHLETLGGGDYLFAAGMLRVLFRREFSFVDSLYLWEMMWALEYDPHQFATYENIPIGPKSKKQCGKFERENLRNGAAASLPISVFVLASLLVEKGSKLQAEAQGVDDVAKILNDITGNIDAKEACKAAMKLHKEYLEKSKNGRHEDRENERVLALTRNNSSTTECKIL